MSNKQFATVNTSTGEITSLLYPPNPNAFTDGQILHDGTKVIATDEELTCHGHYYTGSEFVAIPAKPSQFHDWDWHHKTWGNNLKNMWKQIRLERDMKLSYCDWTQMADSPLSDSEKADWALYRHQLRNFPQWNSSITDYDTIVWPVPPNEWV